MDRKKHRTPNEALTTEMVNIDDLFKKGKVLSIDSSLGVTESPHGLKEEAPKDGGD